MTLPNFLIVGAMKAGTTALHHYLEQHPQVYMSPIKEPNFFAFEEEEAVSRPPEGPGGPDPNSVTDIEAYRSLFQKASGEQALGEASPSYLYSPGTAGRIRRHIPGAKIVLILRNPVERAYSHFLHAVRTGAEPCADFTRALWEEEAGASGSSEDYVGRGLYYGQLKSYFDTFDRCQIRVYLYEDLNSAPVKTVQDLFWFLGVDKTFVPDTSLRHNVSGTPKSEILDGVLRRPNAIKNILKLYLPTRLRQFLHKAFDDLKTRNLAKPPPLPQEARQHLIEVYREDTSKLQEAIGRDLSGWRE